MTQHLSLSQLTLLVGGAVLIGGLLVFLVYTLHKAFQSQRQQADLKPKPPGTVDETTFAMATMQGVIAKMKAQEKELLELRRAAEQRADESARISENIIREMPSGLMVFNREGFISVANPAVRALLGVDTWSRRRYPEILGRQSTLAGYIQECLETGKTATRETIEYCTPHGETRVLGMSLSPYHASNGEIDGAVCLLTDLTETRQLQEQIRLKEHLAALGAMSAGIAHEFKNSLATISGYAQLLRDGEVSEQDRQFTEKIIHEIRSLTQVVTDFLTISKPLQLAAQPVNAEELFRQAIEDLRRVETFGNVAFRLEGDFPPVEGDEVLLRQAFSNLLRNACEAMVGRKDGGNLLVRGETCRQAERGFLRILVSDSGGGISAGERERIFIPFFTTKPTGSGLGLALVQKIIVSHNGSVRLESTSPEGSTFAILLPLPAASGSKPATAPASVRDASPTV